jgi:hypothetical protein
MAVGLAVGYVIGGASGQFPVLRSQRDDLRREAPRNCGT